MASDIPMGVDTRDEAGPSFLRFPPGFVWGAATAALQIEGASGRGLSVWDDFCARHPERIFECATPEVACDHLNRYAEDVAWMQRLGHKGYRFSISWPRVDPTGNGRFSAAGFDFYDRLVDRLLEAGIEPNATLYHWDLPLSLGAAAPGGGAPEALRLVGGWESPQVLERYQAYAAACFERLGDRVALWGTLNEPAWTTLQGYVTGLHPPAVHDYTAAVRVAHHFMVAHGLAVSAFRVSGCKGKIGIALNVSPVLPATARQEDAQAARLADGLLNRWFLQAVARGSYPEDVLAFYERHGLLPEGAASLSLPSSDWLGINYYYPHHCVADSNETAFGLNNSGDASQACHFAIKGLFRFIPNQRGRYTDWAWEIAPEYLEDVLRQVHALAPGLPLYVTENGLGLQDVLRDEEVDDTPRIVFVQEHLAAIHRAVAAGVDVRGYYMWSLMDNFSWINGYKKRYGFLYVNRETQQRTPKKSAWWFAQVAAQNGFFPGQGKVEPTNGR